MAGFIPDEGKTLRARMVLQRTHVDRDADLEMVLFTNVSPTTSITFATLTQPTGTGYAAKTLTDGSWTINAPSPTGQPATSSYAIQTFTGGAGGWTGSVQGYAIVTKSSGGTRRILWIEVDPGGPYTIAEGQNYQITPNCNFS